MELTFRSDLIAWLAADPVLAAGLNAVAEEAPVAAPPPWLGVAASAATDWGSKDAPGRELRLALELTARSDDQAELVALAQALERRIATMPADQGSYRVVVTRFLRSRAERRAGNIRALLSEWRFLLLAA